jgi:hypothetical protein
MTLFCQSRGIWGVINIDHEKLFWDKKRPPKLNSRLNF